MMEEEEAKNPCGVTECLADMRRKVVSNGAGMVDNLSAISTELTGVVSEKAFRFLVYFNKLGYSEELPGHGQGGLIRREKIRTKAGEYSVIPVTAKHNLRSLGEYRALDPKLYIDQSIRVDTQFPDKNWTPTAAHRILLRKGNQDTPDSFWEYGMDISTSPLIGRPGESFTNASRSFGLARSNLKIIKDMTVGIAVVFTPESKPTNHSIVGAEGGSKHLADAVLVSVFGEPNAINIYTGKITYASEGAKHIEYDINSFTGCSGAVVFLLDGEGQHDSVQQCDYGKAIAVHAGAHPVLLKRNIGFLLSNVMQPL